MVVHAQIAALILLLAVGAVSSAVHEHDLEQQALEAKNMLDLFGHFAYVAPAHLAAGVLLLAAAWLTTRSLPKSRFAGKLRAAAFALVALLISLEFFGELAVLGEENQKLLSLGGQVTRITAVAASTLLILWSGALALLLWPPPK